MNSNAHVRVTALYSQYARLVRAVLDRFGLPVQETEDLVQDTFIKAFEKIDQLACDEGAKSWLCALARNLALDHLRLRRRREGLGLSAMPEDGVESETSLWGARDPEPEYDPALVALVRQAITLRSDNPRLEVAHRFYERRESAPVIASELGIRLNTVYSHLMRFRKSLRDQLVEGDACA